jgi:hypothetical protein
MMSFRRVAAYESAASATLLRRRRPGGLDARTSADFSVRGFKNRLSR